MTRRPKLHAQPSFTDFKSQNGCISNEYAYKSVQISFKFKGAFSLLFKWKTASMPLLLLDNWAL